MNRPFSFLALAFMLSGCGFRIDKTATGSLGANGVSGDMRDVVFKAVGYDEVRAQVITPSCMGCHDTRKPSMNNYAELKAEVPQLIKTVFEKKTMPKNRQLDARQISILANWIREGAPENPEDAPPPGTPIGKAPQLQKLVWNDLYVNVVNPSCASCHYKENKKGLTDQTDFATFKNTLGTTMYLCLVQEADSPMPPKTEGPLTAEQKQILTQWVIDGELEK